MTVGEARKHLTHPIFGDKVHIEAMQLLALLAEMGVNSKTLDGIDLDCPKCDGDGTCYHCDQDCDACDGTGKITGNATQVDQLDAEKVKELYESWRESQDVAA